MKALTYNINLTRKDLETISKLSDQITDSAPVLSRKDQYLSTHSKYTVVRTKSRRLILIGNGRKEIAKTEEGNPLYIKNAFLGAGTTGHVKLGFELVKEGQSLQLDEETSFAVKIYRYKNLEPIHIQEIFQAVKKEADIYARMYGMAEMINSRHRQKFMLVIPNLGVPVNTLDFSCMTIESLAEVFVSGLYSLLTLHRLNYRHTDIHLDNFLYDHKNHVVNIIDFSYCDPIETAEDRDLVELEKYTYMSRAFLNLLDLFCCAHQIQASNHFLGFFDDSKLMIRRKDMICSELMTVYNAMKKDLVSNPTETCSGLLTRLKEILYKVLGQSFFYKNIARSCESNIVTLR